MPRPAVMAMMVVVIGNGPMMLHRGAVVTGGLARGGPGTHGAAHRPAEDGTIPAADFGARV
ncbi:MAG: hypothetical protein EA371_13495 [Gammaproteobacteria bacterium]|nr:MAG: hypothetical protein EA371_13495 [Gammaproteobacteria bacterium]